MPGPARSGQNPDDAPREEVILGVDTHKDLHVAVVITMLGGLLGSRSFLATAAGYRQLLAWALGFGQVNRAGVGMHRILWRSTGPASAPGGRRRGRGEPARQGNAPPAR